MDQDIIFILASVELALFLILMSLATLDVLRRAREHRTGLLSQVETLIGPRQPAQTFAPLSSLMHSLRSNTITAFDRFGWVGVARLYASATVAWALLCGATLGSLSLTASMVS